MKQLAKKIAFVVNLHLLNDANLDAVYQRAVALRRVARPRARLAKRGYVRVRVDGRLWEIMQRDAVVIGVNQDSHPLKLSKE